MKIVKTEIEGVFIIEPEVHHDSRGYFLESWSENRFAEAFRDAVASRQNPVTLRPSRHGGARDAITLKRPSQVLAAPPHFVQDNESASTYGVIRGLHFQRPPHAQAKLVRVVQGSVLDIVLDLRKGSPTFGRHAAVELTSDNHLSLFIPPGFAHGFAVLSPTAVFQYKCDNYYAPGSEGGILWNDPDLAIDWRIPPDRAVLSEKDLRNPRLSDFATPFAFE